jgi:ELWxxDGT repeat protein
MMRGIAYFVADDGVHGRELWRSDGTQAGTRLVRNIRADAEGTARGSRPAHLTAVGDTLFFSADDGKHGPELWRSDGTRAGTVLVKDIAPTGGSGPQELARLGRKIFFTARDGRHGRELWRSDGSRTGTVLVKDILPRAPYYNFPINDVTSIGGKLFFAADDGATGSELWSSGGTRASTVLVRDIRLPKYEEADFPGSTPSGFTGFGGQVYFSADDGWRGSELWASDGTRAGTHLVKDIQPDEVYDGSSHPGGFTVAGGRLFFAADGGPDGRALWASDGTGAGTVLVKAIDPTHPEPLDGGGPSGLTRLGTDVMFADNEGVHGRELWRSDGTADGTVLVEDVNPTSGTEPNGSTPSALTTVGDRVFFVADDGTHGRELWTSGGTPDSTDLVADVNPCHEVQAGDGPVPGPLTRGGSGVYFSANDGVHGAELWTSDGTAEGTRMVMDINPAAGP